MLLVVAYHAKLSVPGGYVGVDVFFVISGYVITRGLLRELDATDRIDLLAFYRRRVRRLLPALAVMLGVVSAASTMLLNPFGSTRYFLSTAVAASLSSSNLYVYAVGGGYFSPQDESNPFIHTWSLAIEEQFYFVFPVAMLGAWTIGRRTGFGARRSFVVAMTIVALASLTLSVILAYAPELTPLADPATASRFAFYLPFTRLWQFIVGILLAVWLQRMQRHMPPATGVLGIALIVVASFGFDETTLWPGAAAVVPVLGAALALGSDAGVASRVLSARPLVRLGDLSYSWYLWHWPFIVFTQVRFAHNDLALGLAALLSLIPAALSYRVVENRFRHAPSEPRPTQWAVLSPSRTRRLALLCVGLPILIAGSATAVSTSLGLELPEELVQRSVVRSGSCANPVNLPEDCAFGPEEAPTILLIGDSHAASVADAVIAAGTHTGHRVVVSALSSCPFLTVEIERAALASACTEKQQTDLDLVQSLEPSKILIANRSTFYAAQIAAGPMISLQEGFEPAGDASAEQWAEAMAATVASLQPFTNDVFVLSVVPHFATYDFDSALPAVAAPAGRYPVLAFSDVEDDQQSVVDAEAKALSTIGAHVLDPLPLLCAPTGCPMRDADVFLYHDNHHLSVAGATKLEPLFVTAFTHDDSA